LLMRHRQPRSTLFPYTTLFRSESMDHGEIYKIQLNGQVVGRFGKAGKMPKEFGMVNALDCRAENDLWVGEIWNWRAQKVTLRRRSEEHTSELQSRRDLVCRLLL